MVDPILAALGMGDVPIPASALKAFDKAAVDTAREHYSAIRDAFQATPDGVMARERMGAMLSALAEIAAR